jgi:hypothetical protein
MLCALIMPRLEGGGMSVEMMEDLFVSVLLVTPEKRERERLTSDETTAATMIDGNVKKIRLNFAFAAVQAHATFRLRRKSGPS